MLPNTLFEHMCSLKLTSTLMVLDTMTPDEHILVHRWLGFRIRGVNIWSCGLPKEQQWLVYLVCCAAYIPFTVWQNMVHEWLPVLESICGGVITHSISGMDVATYTNPCTFNEISSNEDGPVVHLYTKDEFFESICSRRVFTWHHDGVDMIKKFYPVKPCS